MKKWLVIIALLPTLVNAQIVINTVSGTIEHDETVTITLDSGNSSRGFGVKAYAPPLVWEDFEDGTVDSYYNKLQSDGWFYTQHPTAPTVNNPEWSDDMPRHQFDTVQLYQNHSYEATGSNVKVWGWYNPPHGEMNKIYFHGYEFRHNYAGNAQYCINWKSTIHFGSAQGSAYMDQPQWRGPGSVSAGDGSNYCTPEVGDATFQLASRFDVTGTYFDEWLREEKYLHYDWTTHDVLTFYLRYNSTDFEALHEGPAPTGPYPGTWGHPGDRHLTYATQGIGWSRAPGGLGYGGNPVIKIYWSEAYLDTSRARVEIGDNVTWDNCTHREILIPITWSTSQITATLFQGEFYPEDNVYLFVIESDGTISDQDDITAGEQGYALEIGGTPVSLPIADFTGTPLSGSVPLAVEFTETTTNLPTSLLWDFGESVDDTLWRSDGETPEKTYTIPGTYTVSLTAYNGDGNNTHTEVDYVTASAAAGALSVTSGSITSGELTLSWTDSNTAPSYVVQADINGTTIYIGTFTDRTGVTFPVTAGTVDITITSSLGDEIRTSVTP